MLELLIYSRLLELLIYSTPDPDGTSSGLGLSSRNVIELARTGGDLNSIDLDTPARTPFRVRR